MTPERAMRRAVQLSRRGFPAPNPHVGCVLVRDGEVVGEGFHAYAGGPHAERVALARAGDNARGSTAYVTLEPCNHHGRTPPCVDGLLDAGVERVVVAVRDPNPRAAGGLDRLESHGVKTEVGLLADEAEAANRRWLTAVRRGHPWVTVKAGISLDGRIALPSGESQWITNEKSRREGHRLRALHAAILVGRGTVEADDPELTARISGVRNQPVRVVIDPRGALPGSKKVFAQGPETLRLGPATAEGGRPVELENYGPMTILSELMSRGLNSVLIEGGGVTIGHFLKAGLVDELHLMVAPKVLGAGPAWASFELGSLAESPRFALQSSKRVDGDLWMTYLSPAA